MPYVHRRTFYGKVGKGYELIEVCQELHEMMRSLGHDMKGRVLSDAMSGRSDRVVVEWQFSTFGEVERAMSAEMGTPQGRKAFAEWFAKLQPLIEYAEAENWEVRDTGVTMPLASARAQTKAPRTAGSTRGPKRR